MGQGRSEEVLRRAELIAEIAKAEKVIGGMRSRLALLESALAEPGAGGPAEVLQVAKLLAPHPEFRRKALIVVQQYHAAEAALRSAQEIHAQFLVSQIEEGVFEDFSLQRFKGSVYPLFNFSLVFQGVPGMEAFFDFLVPPKTGPLNGHHAPASPPGAARPRGKVQPFDILSKAPGFLSRLPFVRPPRSPDD